MSTITKNNPEIEIINTLDTLITIFNISNKQLMELRLYIIQLCMNGAESKEELNNNINKINEIKGEIRKIKIKINKIVNK